MLWSVKKRFEPYKKLKNAKNALMHLWLSGDDIGQHRDIFVG